MSPGFFLDIAENTGDTFSYKILPVKDVKDIPKHYDRHILYNIVRPRDLDCSDAPRVTKVQGTLKFWNAQGEELFAQEELDPNFIPDRFEDIPDVTQNEIVDLLRPTSSITDIHERDSLLRIDGGLPTI